MDKSNSPDMRIQISITGVRALRIRQLMAMSGYRSENEAVQYLINRGLEACSTSIRNWDLLKDAHEKTLGSQAELFANLSEMMKLENEQND